MHRSAPVDVGYLSLSLRDLLHGRLGAPRDDRRPGVVESAPGEQWARRDHKGENWRAVQEWACCAAPHSFQDRSLARRRPRHRVRRFPASGVTSRIDRSRSRDRMPPCNRLVMLCTSCIARDAPAALQTLIFTPQSLLVRFTPRPQDFCRLGHRNLDFCSASSPPLHCRHWALLLNELRLS